ncbi:ImmA/IrrE family metallo-endopeptidase [Desulfuromonas sp. TF]|uniref:ImmA/IrrE family metallo-endopeptidase n=1 Tax=Desulfuromonas sp. TF TaxID=1232410 RepID=UPI000488EEE3|nr:ImmA/IrrE family metallo-endopeptidase [Desulfuromonas sp. TF]
MTSSRAVFLKMSGAQIEQIAGGIIKAIQPKVFTGSENFDIEHFVDVRLEDLTGIQPDYSRLPPEIYGYTDPEQQKMVIQADLAEDDDSERFLRSTLAHETGHCILHVPILRQAQKYHIFKQEKGAHLYRKESGLPLYQNPEWQAWRFAGALLMPKDLVVQMLKEGLSERGLANKFNVNPAFVRYRLKSLKLSI